MNAKHTLTIIKVQESILLEYKMIVTSNAPSNQGVQNFKHPCQHVLNPPIIYIALSLTFIYLTKHLEKILLTNGKSMKICHFGCNNGLTG